MVHTLGMEEVISAGAQLRKGPGGFSLLEMLVVIFMIGIMVGIAAPAIKDYLPRYRLKRAANDLYTSLQRAKMDAIHNGRNYTVVFDTDTDIYEIRRGGADGILVRTIRLPIYGSGVRYGRGNAREQATIGGGPFPSSPSFTGVTYPGKGVTFNSRGMVVGGLGFVYLQNDSGDVYAVATPNLASGIILRRWFNNGWY